MLQTLCINLSIPGRVKRNTYAEFQIELLLLLSLYFLRWKLKHKINTISAAFIADTKSCLSCEIYIVIYESEGFC